MENNKDSQKNQWHLWFAQLLEYLLSPVGIIVQPEPPVVGKADILLLKRENEQWTPEQLALLPDGVRNSQASHILLEFKYTETVNEDAFRQASGYDVFYIRGRDLAEEQVQTFLISAKKPQTERLIKFGYEHTKHDGVYRTSHWAMNRITLISINELSDEPHNMWVKCFATHRTEREKAFEHIKRLGVKFMTNPLKWFLTGLWEYWFKLKGEEMNIALTPKQITEMGKMWLPIFSVEERLAGLKAPEVLAHFKPEERLAGLKAPERLAGLKAPEVLAHFKPEERLAGLKAPEVLANFKPEERLAGLSMPEVFAHFKPNEIENYLNQLKKSKKQD